MAVQLGVPESVAGAPLVRRLAWVTGARLAVLTVAVGAVALLNLARGFEVGAETIQAVVATVAVAFGLTVAYAGLLRAGRYLDLVASAQLVFDQIIFTGLVYLTGGASSGATSFYGLTCLVGAFLTGLRGAAVAASSGAVCYLILALGMHWQWILPPKDQRPEVYFVTGEELTYYVVVNLLVMVIVTLLASNLAERLRTAGGRIVAAEQRADRAERMAELGRLAAGLAHEIRNPLGSISGSIQLIRANPKLNAEDKQLCDIIQRETSRLSDLVSDMMNVAKPQHPELAVVDAARIARDVVDLAENSGRAVSDVAVRFEGPDVVAVRADASQLRQLVWNLVRNAVQASNAGDEVGVTISELDDRTIELAVADDGAGLEPEAKERLFDAFFTTRSHGTGIGLAVVKRIADDHGFSIVVDSERGKGATFRVNLGPHLDETPAPEPSVPIPSTIPPG